MSPPPAPTRDPGRPRSHARRHDGATDGGSISILVLGMVVVIMLVIAIVFDDGSALADRQHAADIAAQAARTGADVILPGNGATVAPQLDPVRAEAAARAYLAAAGVTGTATATQTTVTVTVTIIYRTKLLSMIGITTFTIHGTATAQPVPGLITPEGA